ncbi:hypothetical protein Pfo_006841 [Paulownia fortunei]|nr:hypothetical protein Pfo_006841 [Paulownia fortunei]
MLNPLPLISSRSFLTPFLYLRPFTSRHLLLRRPTAAVRIIRASSSSAQTPRQAFTFGPYEIDPKEVFYATQLSFAFVNLRPVLPGMHFPFQIFIFDGPQSGQTVPHVHIHILPRKSSDFEKNDEIYDAIDLKEKELKQKLDLDKERSDRRMEERAEEADEYRKLLL